MSTSCKVLTLNIEGHKHLHRHIPFLQKHRPEVICLQEVFEVDVPAFQAALPEYTTFFLPFVNYTQPNRYNIAPLGNWGLAILTRLPVVHNFQDTYVGQADVIPEFIDGDPNSGNRSLLGVTVDKNGQPFTIITTHFTWTPNGQTNDAQRHALNSLLGALKQFPEFMLCGDFNAPRGGEIYQKICAAGLTDHIPPETRSTLDPQLFRVKNLQLVIDFCFTTPSYTMSNVKVLEGLSDHCGVMGEILFAVEK